MRSRVERNFQQKTHQFLLFIRRLVTLQYTLFNTHNTFLYNTTSNEKQLFFGVFFSLGLLPHPPHYFCYYHCRENAFFTFQTNFFSCQLPAMVYQSEKNCVHFYVTLHDSLFYSLDMQRKPMCLAFIPLKKQH